MRITIQMKPITLLAALFALGVASVPNMAAAQTRANVPPPKKDATTAPADPKKPNGKKMMKGDKGSKKAVANSLVVLITPVDTPGGIADQLSDDVVAVVQRRLEASEMYSSVFMRRSLATVRRALWDQTLTASDVEKPFNLNTKLEKLSRVTGYKAALVATIGEYKFDEEKKTVTLDVTLKMVDFSSGKPVTKTASEVITGKPGSAGQTEVQIALDSVRSATEKLMTSLLSSSSAAPAKTEPAKTE